MSYPEELIRQERRRRIIERLNDKEEFFDLARSARREQMGEEELEIERERNYSRRGFGQIYDGGGGDFGGAGGDGGGGGGEA